MGEHMRDLGRALSMLSWTIDSGHARHPAHGTWKDKGGCWRRIVGPEAWLSDEEMLALMGGIHETHNFVIDEPGEWGQDDPYCTGCHLPPDAVEAALPCAGGGE